MSIVFFTRPFSALQTKNIRSATWCLLVLHTSICQSYADNLKQQRSEIYIDRKSKQLWVLSDKKQVTMSSLVGIGRGGLKEKRNMDDLVTPTGKFTVDLILFKDKKYNQIAAAYFDRYKGTNFEQLFQSQDSLAKLFSNMNSLDFNGDGKGDQAYGDGYIGMTGTSREVSGPKMNYFRQTPYWYSIAMHGTNNPQNFGAANSGGCIHIPADVLSKLITGKVVELGTPVVVGDTPPR